VDTPAFTPGSKSVLSTASTRSICWIANVQGMSSVSVVKRAFRYRFSPSAAQEVELLRTFACVRVVYNRALEARSVVR
jgi:hypothetical protein